MSNVTKNVKASDFVNAIGVNTKATMMYGSYSNSSLIIKSMNYIGINKVRNNLVEYGKAVPILDAMADAGIKFNVLVNTSLPRTGAEGMRDYIEMLKDFKLKHPGAILSIEGPNEVNNFPISFKGDSSIAGAVAFQKYLYTEIKSEYFLNKIPIYNFTIAYNTEDNYGHIGNISQYSDAANLHLYMSTTGANDSRMEASMALAQNVSRGDPLVVTEIGHTTLRTQPVIGTSLKAQAKMMLSELLLAYENGAQEMFIYELFDNRESASRGEKERFFGLFSESGTPKPAAVALHNLTTILTYGDDGTADGVLPTTFTVQSKSSTVHAMSFEKSGGVYNIAVWNDRSVWDDAKDLDYNNPIINTVVDLGRIEGIVRVYDPMIGINPISTYNNVRNVTLPLRDSPLIIEVGADSPVEERKIVSAPKLTMTSAEFLAQIDTLAIAVGLEKITLTDGNIIKVSSVDTMEYIIKNYWKTLNKISGDYIFETAYGQETWNKISRYDSDGTLKLTTTDTLQDGVLRAKSILQTNGVKDYWRYGIEGKSYVTEHQGYDATGRLHLLERFHADGSYDLRDVRYADGSRVYEKYDELGRLTFSQGNSLLKYDAGAVNDMIFGKSVTSLRGGEGDDIIFSLSGDDVIDGGDGVDTLSYERLSAKNGINVDLNISSFQETGGGFDKIIGIENLTGSIFNDNLRGNSADNVIRGAGGNDVIDGRGGSDTASYLGDGAVTVDLGTSGRQNTIGAGYDTLISIENLIGSAFGDTLIGDTGANVIKAGAGNDVINGGAGVDTLSGGAGTDIFVFTSSAHSPFGNHDTIIAFDNPGAKAGDRIDLSAIDANGSAPGNGAFTFGSAAMGGLRAVNVGADTFIYANLDADATPEFAIRITDGAANASSYTAADFIL